VYELIELEVTDVAARGGEHDRQRTAKRHATRTVPMTLGGRRVAAHRPRMGRAGYEREPPTRSDEHFADCNPLARAVIDRMLAGV
jgi:hypothetical protein